jgi:protein ImuB
MTDTPAAVAAPRLLYACVYRLPALEPAAPAPALMALADQFSPRYERHTDDLVSIDVSGLERLLGPPQKIGEELRREAADRGLRVHVAMARRRMAALVLALARPGLTVVGDDEEAATLAPIRISVLDHLADQPQSPQSSPSFINKKVSVGSVVSVVQHWGIRTLGELAALPAGEVRARLGHEGLVWQAIARGDDIRPLVPTRADERFDGSMDLEWPIEELEPLSFVLTRLLEPLSIRLERRDRGAAVLHVHLRLVTKEMHVRRLELPTPMRDVRTLRTLALLDLEAHPAPAAIDRVTIVIDPTPGRILQHTLFARPVPTPEQISTLLARLHALMGQARVGTPATVDSYRPGAFEMKPFATDHDQAGRERSPQSSTTEPTKTASFEKRLAVPSVSSAVQARVVVATAGPDMAGALRRCRQPVPARVVVDRDERPVRVTTERRGFAGGTVASCSGPWRTSGSWWAGEARAPVLPAWNRDEWDVTLGDGGRYRIFRDRVTEAWFIDAIVD